MASEAAVRAFFQLSRLDEHYFTVGQEMLADAAFKAEEDMPHESECERFAVMFVAYMATLYANRFTDIQMTLLILQFQTETFRKLVATEVDLIPEISSFIEREAGRILGVEFKVADETKAPSSSRLN
ncbi:MAG: hypothetical protein WA021_02665 [Minisyncoccia bacterium]